MNSNTSYIFITLTFTLFFLSCVSGSRYTKQIDGQRINYKLSFTENPRSPLTTEDTANLRFYAIDKKYRCKAKFHKSTDTTTIQIPTYSGIFKPYQVYGSLVFTLENQKCSLQVYYSPTYKNHPLYKNHLFLPFKDFTNSDSTYGGGRYLDLSILDIGKNNDVIVDFNHAYNPWCAYSDGYNCPVPPKPNHLPVYIKAGEKKYAGEYKHK